MKQEDELTGIDTSFDVRSDAGGRDPDTHSATLRRYHRLLWSKRLPSGVQFDLVDTTPGVYLHHCSDLGEFFLASDQVIATLTGRASRITDQIPEIEREDFDRIGSTIGGMLVFPGNRVDGKMTINGAKGFHPRIVDRLDLTLECIRRHYLGMSNPIGDTLTRFADFFALFTDFRGYVDFFLLQDLVSDDRTTIRFFMPFDNFTTPAVPKDFETYKEFRRLSIEFVLARNRRIDALHL